MITRSNPHRTGDPVAIDTFLRRFFEGAKPVHWLVIQSFNGDGTPNGNQLSITKWFQVRKLDEAVAWAQAHKDQDLYIATALYKTAGGGRKNSNIVARRWVCLEFDGAKHTDANLDEILDDEPTLRVRSSVGANGVNNEHVYLDKGKWYDDPEAMERIDAETRAIADRHPSVGDRKDGASLFRIPGTMHRKNPRAPQLVELLSDNETVYALRARESHAKPAGRQGQGVTHDTIPWDDSAPCEAMRTAVARHDNKPGSRHNSMLKIQREISELYREGHIGHTQALESLNLAFDESVAGETRNPREFQEGLDGLLSKFGWPKRDVTRDPCVKGELTRIPDWVYDRRPNSLGIIRQNAHADFCSPDAVLGVTMSRLSASIPHTLTVDSGRPKGSTLNTFTAIVGKPGTGKSAAAGIDLIPKVDRLRGRDGIGLGSGEGLISTFMGRKEVPVDEDVFGDETKKGKTEMVRCQTKHNAFFFVDEGQTLLKQAKERKGSTLLETIRTLWAAGSCGQRLARDEDSRQIEERTYCVGFTIGFQMKFAVSLVQDDEGGTPQRFLFFEARAKNLPRPRPKSAGLLPDVVTELPHGAYEGFVMSTPQGILDEMEETARARSNEQPFDEWDTHRDWVKIRVAALLALMEGRYHVNDEDWEIAGVIWEVSSGVRGSILKYAAEEAEAKRVKRDEEAYSRAALARLGEGQAEESFEHAKNGILTAFKTHGAQKRKFIRDKVSGRHKRLFTPVWDSLLEDGVIHDIGDGTFTT